MLSSAVERYAAAAETNHIHGLELKTTARLDDSELLEKQRLMISARMPPRSKLFLGTLNNPNYLSLTPMIASLFIIAKY